MRLQGRRAEPDRPAQTSRRRDIIAFVVFCRLRDRLTLRDISEIMALRRLEQDHRRIKGRIRWMHGFKSHDAAARFCREHGDLRNLLHPCRHNQIVPASLRRFRFAKAAQIELDIMHIA